MTYFGSASESIQPEAARRITIKKLRLRSPPLEVYLNLRKNNPTSFLLESATGPKRLAEYSFIGFNPAATLSVKQGKAAIIDREGHRTSLSRVEEPLELVRSRLLKTRKTGGLPRFAGGAVGYISYDAVNYFERIGSRHAGSTPYPDLEFGVYEDGVVFDHTSNATYYFTLGEDRSREVEEADRTSSDEGELRASDFKANMSRDQFEDAVATAKDYISQGDIFQVVLSRRIDLSTKGDLSRFYRALRKINPSPYMYFFSHRQRQIIGSSPEMLVRVEGGQVETFPIAGTRPVVQDENECSRLAAELLQDPKEKAEHLMLVDLARNDIGKVARFGSVRVREFMTVQRFSHVQHIVSRVTGELREECDAFDAMEAVFPAGTVSGAPKVRAMEIIDELEPSSRGPYAGAVGYFSSTGDADFAIAIRTLVASDGAASIQAGAGIVADSIPVKEFEETERKAAALTKAFELAEEGKT